MHPTPKFLSAFFGWRSWASPNGIFLLTSVDKLSQKSKLKVRQRAQKLVATYMKLTSVYHSCRNAYCQSCQNDSMILDKSQSILKTICLVNEIRINLGGWGTVCGLAIGIMSTATGWYLKKIKVEVRKKIWNKSSCIFNRNIVFYVAKPLGAYFTIFFIK